MKTTMLKKATLLSAVVLSTLACSLNVFAEESDKVIEKDSANNVFFAGDNIGVVGESVFGGFGAGYTVKVENTTFDDGLAAAGYNVNIESVKADSTVYAAGYNISVDDSEIGGNLVTCGYNINMDSHSKAKSVLAAGCFVGINGEIEGGNVSGETVTINGRVDGDLKVEAENIIIGNDAVVTGTLFTKSENEPEVSKHAQIGNLKWEEIKKTEEVQVKKTAAEVVFGKVKSGIYWAIAMVLVALIMRLLMTKELDEASVMVKTRTGAMLGTGAITLICVPIASIIGLCTVVGAPTVGIVFSIYMLINAISVAFAAASLAPFIIKKVPVLGASLIGVAVVELLKQIPILGGLISIAACIYTLGYFVQSLYLKRMVKEKKEDIVIE